MFPNRFDPFAITAAPAVTLIAAVARRVGNGAVWP